MRGILINKTEYNILILLNIYMLFSSKLKKSPSHGQAHFILLVPHKIKRACLFPPPIEFTILTFFLLDTLPAVL